MNKIWKESYFNRRNWLLEHIVPLKLNEKELVVLLLIDLLNDNNEAISIETLGNKSGLTENEVDEVVSNLCVRGLINIVTNRGKIEFNIDGVFSQPVETVEGLPLFKTFENEFARPLTQYELTMLNEWLRNYDEKFIFHALRRAAIYRKLNMKYIDSILANWKKNNITVAMIEEGHE